MHTFVFNSKLSLREDHGNYTKVWEAAATLNEADTRAKLIDPVLHSRGWNEGSIKREVTAGAIEIVGGIPRQRATGSRCKKY